jgi:hypothetical protein
MGDLIQFPLTKTTTVTRPTKAETPLHVKEAMDLWRVQGCWADVPECYVEFHDGLASEELTRIATKFNLKVLIQQVQEDGNMDGMRVRHVFVETPTGYVKQLVWHDSNQGFMIKHESGGASIMFEKDLV